MKDHLTARRGHQDGHGMGAWAGGGAFLDPVDPFDTDRGTAPDGDSRTRRDPHDDACIVGARIPRRDGVARFIGLGRERGNSVQDGIDGGDRESRTIVVPRTTSSFPRDHPWRATILQAYLFGLVHVFPGGNLSIIVWTSASPFIAALVAPQTWEGIVLGRLYLRRGLEAAIVAHIVLDLAIFSFLIAGLMIMRNRM